MNIKRYLTYHKLECYTIYTRYIMIYDIYGLYAKSFGNSN